MIVWILEALESWGISKFFGWFFSFFRRTPQKDMEQAHDVENKVAGLSDDSVAEQLRNRWTR